ncbi:hypothetical protein WICMUC_003609 [Wickerhamomyces mucosus]|uniref:Bud22 domain-containing protein n=1 Tax=Wickerhamomyces mucosus TaxID=1378264 RepID=A0A9P8TBL1_9ASCO|nr:hypothetical protein WICMUC_003609 [Wickerhamomyces mucosus]
MASKQNNLWKLDLLEVKYLKKPARFPRTKTLIRTKQEIKLFQKIQNYNDEIISLKSDIFNKKLHSSLIKYKRILKKIIKSLQNNNNNNSSSSSSSIKNLKSEEIQILQKLDLDEFVKSRIIKLIQTLYRINSKSENLKDQFPFVSDWIIDSIIDKSSSINPSNYYNSLSTLEKNLISKLINHKDLKEILKPIENGFKIVVGPVEKEKNVKDIEDLPTSDDDDEEDEADEDDDKVDNNDVDNESDIEGTEDIDYSQFDGLIAGSDEEDNDDDEIVLDKSINYNEVTDEEPSEDENDDQDQESSSDEDEDEDEFFEQQPQTKKSKLEKKEKHNLPELQYGYVSGDSDSEIDNDSMVESITKPQKKNRRGQRARQQIWEKKYGKGAKHIVKEKEEKAKIRQQKQLEFEERQRRREEKLKLAIESGEIKTGGNSTPLGIRNSNGNPSIDQINENNTKLHPSWEAKKKQQDALKKVKFEGKKITFD